MWELIQFPPYTKIRWTNFRGRGSAPSYSQGATSTPTSTRPGRYSLKHPTPYNLYIYIFIYTYIYICTTCMYIFIDICIYICIYINVYEHARVRGALPGRRRVPGLGGTPSNTLHPTPYISIYVYMYIYMYTI